MSNLKLLLIAILFATVSSCVDRDFDEPPPNGVDPDIEPTHTIRQLLEEYPPAMYHVIEDDVVIEGIVVADDQSGNYFRSIVIQDESAGIQLRLDATELWNQYEIGRRLFIKCNGLVVGNFADLPQLGGGFERDNQGNIESIAGIPEVLLNEYIERGQWNQTVEPTVKRVSELDFYDLNTLIKLENAQFAASEVGQPFAIDTVTSGGTEVKQSVNRTLTSCEGEPAILVRTSGFATFANERIPNESGSIVGIYSVFADDQQIFMRDIDDISEMTEPRCGSASVIQGIRSSYAGSPTTIPNGTVFTAEVISDRSAGNINTRNIVVQDSEGYGIVVRFTAEHNFDLGDVVQVDASQAELSDFNGLVQINELDNLKVTVVDETINVVPREVTVDQIYSNHENLESTLVRLRGATLSGGAVFSGSLDVTDATGTIPMFTQSGAVFANDPIPTDPSDLTLIVSDFNGPQVNLRNGNDIEGGSGGEPDLVDIAAIRDLFDGSTSTIGQNFQIEGVVISDRSNENTHPQNLVVQDGTAGIVIRFSTDHSFDLGDMIRVRVLGQELSEFNGLLQVNNVPPANADNLGNGNLPTPRQTTISDLLDNGEEWESTLVVIENATISGSSTFEGSTTVNDGTGSIPMFTRSAASFASQSIPQGVVKMTCVVSEFNDRQVFIRNLGDIE